MRKSLFLYCSLIFFLAACSSGKDSRIPKNVLKKEKMAEVLTDVHIAEGKLNNMPLTDSTKALARQYYAEIFKIHHITPEEFQRSMDFYMDNPKILEEVYEPVLQDLNEKSSKYWK